MHPGEHTYLLRAQSVKIWAYLNTVHWSRLSSTWSHCNPRSHCLMSAENTNKRVWTDRRGVLGMSNGDDDLSFHLGKCFIVEDKCEQLTRLWQKDDRPDNICSMLPDASDALEVDIDPQSLSSAQGCNNPSFSLQILIPIPQLEVAIRYECFHFLPACLEIFRKNIYLGLHEASSEAHRGKWEKILDSGDPFFKSDLKWFLSCIYDLKTGKKEKSSICETDF